MKINNIDAKQILQFQRNRYPCFFVDYLSEVIPGEKASGYKLFSCNESYFYKDIRKSFEVPKTIQTEVLEQVFLMTFLTLPECINKKTATIKCDSYFFEGISSGERLDIIAKLTRFRRGIAEGIGEGFVDSKLAIRSEFLVSVPDIINCFKPLCKGI